MDWRDAAACRHHDPDLFFPVGVDERAVELAVAVCRDCTVSGECLRWALENDVQFGVWGGVGEHEREMAARQRRRTRVQSA